MSAYFLPEERSEFRDLPVRARFASICGPRNPDFRQGRQNRGKRYSLSSRLDAPRRRGAGPGPRNTDRTGLCLEPSGQRIWVPDFRPACAGHASGMTRVEGGSNASDHRTAAAPSDWSLLSEYAGHCGSPGRMWRAGPVRVRRRCRVLRQSRAPRRCRVRRQ